MNNNHPLIILIIFEFHVQHNTNHYHFIYILHINSFSTLPAVSANTMTMGGLLLPFSLLLFFILTLPHPMNTLSIIQVGDSLVFNHKQQEDIYLFNSQRAFQQCNFAQANLLHHLTWHPPQPGYYYFSTRSCESGEKLSLRVVSPPQQRSSTSPAFPPLAAPPPTSGGDLPSLPSNGWVPTPTSSNNGPSPSPTSEAGIPFINSNPAVPIPTGETDTTTIRPLPMSRDGTQVVVGLGWKHLIQMEVVVVLPIITSFTLGFFP